MTGTSPITNCWGTARTSVIPTEEIVIFRGGPGAWYNHHHQVLAFDGRLYATWSCADVHEDSPGQRMMLSTSDDEGKSWSEARPLVDRRQGEFDEVVITSAGLHEHNGRMVAYYGHYDYREPALRLLLEQTTGLNGKADTSVKWHQDTFEGILVSDDAGETWEEVNRIPCFASYLAPSRLQSGRLILPGQMWFPWTDDPYGIEGWNIAAIPRLPNDYCDDSQGFWFAKEHRGDDFVCCEGTFFQTDDGVVHMIVRTEIDQLAVTESHDNGVTYSEPMMTTYNRLPLPVPFRPLAGPTLHRDELPRAGVTAHAARAGYERGRRPLLQALHRRQRTEHTSAAGRHPEVRPVRLSELPPCGRVDLHHLLRRQGRHRHHACAVERA